MFSRHHVHVWPTNSTASQAVTSFTPSANRNLLSTAWSGDVAQSLEEDAVNAILGSSAISACLNHAKNAKMIILATMDIIMGISIWLCVSMVTSSFLSSNWWNVVFQGWYKIKINTLQGRQHVGQSWLFFKTEFTFVVNNNNMVEDFEAFCQLDTTSSFRLRVVPKKRWTLEL